MTFGYDIGALSGATQGLMHSYRFSPALFGLAVSASLWGALAASLVAGRLADTIGRRGLLAWCAALYALAATALALPAAWPWNVVLALRLLCGLTIGGFVVASPLYLAEIAPRQLRGRYVGLFQLQIGGGMAVAFAVSAVLAHHMQEIAEWRWCFGLGAIPPACLVLLLHWLSEEPHWLARHDRQRDAVAAARRLGFSPAEWSAAAIQISSSSSVERLFCRAYVRPLLLATAVALFNQLCGVTVLRVYLLDLLATAGVPRLMSHRYGVILACLNLAALLVGTLIVDKIGRRRLLVAGSAGMALCLFALALALRLHAAAIFYLMLLAAYNIAFAFSQGTVAWLYLSEIFPFSVRGKGQSYGAFVHWVANAGLVWLFPVLEHAAPRTSLLFFAFMMILQVAIVLLWYPETKGTRLGAVAEAVPCDQ